MKNLTQRLLKILTFLGLLCLSIPLLILGLWIHAFDLGASQTTRVAIFNNYFPDFLHGRYNTSYLSLIFCLLTIIFGSISLKLKGILWKTLNLFILIFGSLLLLLNLWGMM